MISFANLHDDIGNDLFDHKEQLNRLDEFHYPRFKEGNMKFSAIVCCFSGTESDRKSGVRERVFRAE